MNANLTPQDLEILAALFSFGSRDVPASLDALTVELARTSAKCRRRTDVAQGLGRLEALGLVDGARVRLTMSGLAVAVAAPRRARRAPVLRAA